MSQYDCGEMLRVVMFRRREIETHASIRRPLFASKIFLTEHYSFEYNLFLRSRGADRSCGVHLVSGAIDVSRTQTHTKPLDHAIDD